MNIFVTGATGFIGSYLLKKINTGNNKITCLVRNIPKNKVKNVTYIKGDILDKKSIELACKNPEIVYHLVGEGRLSAVSKEEFKKFYKVNVLGTKNLLEVLRKTKPKKIIAFSSTAAVGLTSKITDEDSPCKPSSPYQKSKRKMENLLLDYHKKFQMPIVIIRPSMVYGPGSRNSEIWRIAKFVKKGFFPRFDDGKTIVPMVHVEDLVEASILASKKGKNGNIYLITNETLSSMNYIVDCVSNSLNTNHLKITIPKNFAKAIVIPVEKLGELFNIKPLITIDRIESMTTSRVFSVAKAAKELGWHQKVSLKEGIQESIDWFKLSCA